MKRTQRLLLCLLLLPLYALSPTTAEAAACAVTYGTVSGTTRYAIFDAGTGCTWTVPSGITSISYLAVGGGGGGGGARAVAISPNLGGGGGGAGGVVQSSSFSTSGGATITLTVGTGGAGGAASSNGSSGTATTFTYASTTITAAAGGGGYGASGTFDQYNLSGDGGSNGSYNGGGNNWDGGGGGAGSGGQGLDGIDIGGQGGTGGGGGAGVANTLLGVTNYYGAGGGGGGTPSANSSETNGFGGTGGNSIGGNGGGGAGTLPTAGAANTGSGGGGGGWRYTSSDALRAGAAGADGRVIFVYTKSAGSVSTIAMSSSSGADNTYKIADAIRVTVTTSETVTVSGTPRIPVLGLSGKYYTYLSGSGSTSLVFSYSVLQNDSATAGVGVSANTLELNSGTLLDTSGLAITLTHNAVAQSSSHAVDGIYPSFVGVTQSFSLAENISRTITLTTTESVTVAFSGGQSDVAYFTLNTSVNPPTLTLSARDFENKLDYDTNNSYYVGVTLTDLAGNRTGSQNFFITITDVAEAAQVGTPTLSTTAIKGVSTTISATSDVAGKFTFYANKKRIAGCIGIAATGTAPNLSAQCNWKPTTRLTTDVYAVFTPTSSSYTAATTSQISVRPGTRSTTR